MIKKTILLIPVVFLLVLSFAFATQKESLYNETLVNWDADVNCGDDTSPYDEDGAVVGNPVFETDGSGDGSCRFDGTADMIAFNGTRFHEMVNQTCWVLGNTTNTANNIDLFARQDDGLANDYYFRLHDDAGTLMLAVVNDAEGDTVNANSDRGSSLTQGNKNFFVFRINQTGTDLFVSFFINDTQITEDTAASAFSTNTINWTVGGREQGTDTSFVGNLKNAGCINRSLNGQEITFLNELININGTNLAAEEVIAGEEVNNTIPTINIDFPINGSRIDNSTLYPLKINGTVTIQNGSVMNITINDTNWFNSGNATLFNFTFNGSLVEGFWSINISANSTAGNRTSTTIDFYIDITNPTAVSSLDNNHTLFYLKENITFEINITDNLLLFSLNVTTPEGYNVSFDNVNTTKYIFNGSINVSTYSIGRHTITSEFCDAHTTFDLPDWPFIKRSDKKIAFENGLTIGPDKSLEWINIEVIKHRNKYSFKYTSKEVMINAFRRFVVEGQSKVSILGNQKGYDAWLVVDGREWVDHNLKSQPNAEYKIIRISEKKVIVEISGLYGKQLEFSSTGRLNCAAQTWDYYIFNYTATFSSTAIETTKDLIILQIDFADIIVVGNGTLNYNGVKHNTTNTTSSSQLNLTLNFTIPQVSANISNVTFFWNFVLNTSSFTTINYTQEINRIQLATCGGLTDVTTLNISIFNEEIVTEYLEASVDAVFNVWTNDSGNTVNFTFDFDGDTNYSICIFPNTTLNVNAILFYNTTGGFRERWYLRSARLTTNASYLNLYNFKSTTGIDELRGILRDSKFAFFKSIYTELQRFYPTENIWRTIQMDKSDDLGNVLFHIIEGTQDYRLLFIRDNTRIDDTDTLKFLCDTNDICDVTFLIDDSAAVTDPELTFVYGYNNISQVFQLNWSDTTGLTNSIRLRVTKETGSASLSICDITTSTSSGTINCNTTGHTGTIRAEIYKTQSPERPFIVVFINKVVDVLYKISSIGIKETGLWAIGISATMIIAGTTVGGPGGAILAYIFSLIVIFMLGIQNFVTIGFITLVGTMGTIVAILIRQRER